MLSDIEIKKLLRYCNIINRPLIEPFDSNRLGPCSYDVTTYLENEDEESLYLVSVETFNIPRKYLGIVCLRSNASKRTSPVIASYSQLVDPGYSGKLIFRVLKLKYSIGNLTNLFQILFFKIEGKVSISYSERKSSTAMNRKGF
jgi:deoxycytidine triphosphate deaminase